VEDRIIALFNCTRVRISARPKEPEIGGSPLPGVGPPQQRDEFSLPMCAAFGEHALQVIARRGRIDS
jgi:hypothetical protein